MGKGLILWLLGVPVSLIALLWFLGFLRWNIDAVTTAAIETLPIVRLPVLATLAGAKHP